jgi:3-hydroxyacyl-[acyl-carrier-protein] dehydratase
MSAETPRSLGFSELRRYLRHTYPMLMVDRVIDWRPSEHIEVLYAVSANSPSVSGHFPERAIFPGTNILQVAAQAGIILLQLSTSRLADDELTLVGSTRARFFRPVVPGDGLRMRLDVQRHDGPLMLLRGEAAVDGQRAASVELSLIRKRIEEMGRVLW